MNKLSYNFIWNFSFNRAVLLWLCHLTAYPAHHPCHNLPDCNNNNRDLEIKWKTFRWWFWSNKRKTPLVELEVVISVSVSDEPFFPSLDLFPLFQFSTPPQSFFDAFVVHKKIILHCFERLIVKEGSNNLWIFIESNIIIPLKCTKKV